jgi:hypothetical protein
MLELRELIKCGQIDNAIFPCHNHDFATNMKKCDWLAVENSNSRETMQKDAVVPFSRSCYENYCDVCGEKLKGSIFWPIST